MPLQRSCNWDERRQRRHLQGAPQIYAAAPSVQPSKGTRCDLKTRLQSTGQQAPSQPPRPPDRGPGRPTGRSFSDKDHTARATVTSHQISTTSFRTHLLAKTEQNVVCCNMKSLRMHVTSSYLQRPQPRCSVLTGRNHKSPIPAKATPVYCARVSSQNSPFGLFGGQSCVVPNANGAVVKATLIPKRPTCTRSERTRKGPVALYGWQAQHRIPQRQQQPLLDLCSAHLHSSWQQFHQGRRSYTSQTYRGSAPVLLERQRVECIMRVAEGVATC